MDSRELQVARSILGVALVSLLALPAQAETTAWLVRPLYPGQEALVSRTEAALDKLMPGEARKGSLIGLKELAGALKGRHVEELPCFSPAARCADPIDAFFTSLGFDRVVLIEGGQDEAGFKYKVSAFEPGSSRVTPSSATAPNLEKALLGAVAKVVAAASTLEVTTTPPGASVYVDDIKVGVTPLSTQVLPGERVVRLDLKLHQPVEDTVVIPIRGSASLDRALEKVAARIVITASPPGTEIFIDGQLLGKDKVDRGILPGTHTIRLSAELHKRFEQQISVKADEQYVLDKTLEPSSGYAAVEPARIVDTPGTVRVGPPPTEAELVYDRKAYLQASFEYANFLSPTLVSRRWGDAGFGRTEGILTNNNAPATLMGVGMEYGTFGKYFGVTVFGVSYLTNVEHWGMTVGTQSGVAEPDPDTTRNPPRVMPTSLDTARVHLVTLRTLHPQFRIALWRFMLGLQAGFEFRTGQVVQVADDVFFNDGFVVLDLLASARFNLRFFLVGGLYLLAQGNYTQYLIGETTNSGTKSSSSWGFNVGVGYGF